MKQHFEFLCRKKEILRLSVSQGIQLVEKVSSVWLSAGVTALAQVISPPLEPFSGQKRRHHLHYDGYQGAQLLTP